MNEEVHEEEGAGTSCNGTVPMGTLNNPIQLSEKVTNLTSDGKNSKLIMCQFCPSKILEPQMGKFIEKEVSKGSLVHNIIGCMAQAATLVNAAMT